MTLALSDMAPRSSKSVMPGARCEACGHLSSWHADAVCRGGVWFRHSVGDRIKSMPVDCSCPVPHKATVIPRYNDVQGPSRELEAPCMSAWAVGAYQGSLFDEKS